MRDLENGTAVAVAAKEEENHPLIREQEEQEVEEYNNMNSSNASTTPPSSVLLVTPEKRSKCVILLLVIVSIALVAAHVPVSQIRITISIADGGTPATAAKNNEVLSMNKDFQTEASTLHEKAGRGESSTASVSSSNSSNARMHVDNYTNCFDYSSSWCSQANCNGTPLCYPCQRRWLIVVTVGRSASTTLTEMLALLPGVRMTGENNNLVGRFENLLKAAPLEMREGTAPAWFHNTIPKESWSCAAQTLFTTANPPKLINGELLENDEQTILGFKTIRLFHNDIQKNENHLTKSQVERITKEKLVTLNHLFPCARFVVNFRSDKNSQLVSWEKQFGGTNTTKAAQLLEAEDDLLHMFHKVMGPQRSYLLDSTEWTRNITIFNEMIDWLGFSSPQCHFKAPLEYNTQNGFYATKTVADCSLNPECTFMY